MLGAMKWLGSELQGIRRRQKARKEPRDWTTGGKGMREIYRLGRRD
jgi:hypothetical protein